MGKFTAEPPQFEDGALGTSQSTTSAGSAALPQNTLSKRAKVYMFTQSGTTPTRVAIGDSTIVATTSGHFFVSADSPIFVNCNGQTHFAWDASASNTLLVTPITNGGSQG